MQALQTRGMRRIYYLFFCREHIYLGTSFNLFHVNSPTLNYYEVLWFAIWRVCISAKKEEESLG